MRECVVDSTFDETSAEVAAGLLRANGIPVRVTRHDAALAVIGPTPVGGFDIRVPEANEKAARRLLGTESGRRRS